MIVTPTMFIHCLLFLLRLAVVGLLLYLIVRALRVYIRSKDVRTEKKETSKSLGEVLRQHRMDCKMTQEFVAEALGVSRQAVSKWEGGASSPSTANLMALAKLYGVCPEDLLRESQG